MTRQNLAATFPLDWRMGSRRPTPAPSLHIVAEDPGSSADDRAAKTAPPVSEGMMSIELLHPFFFFCDLSEFTFCHSTPVTRLVDARITRRHEVTELQRRC